MRLIVLLVVQILYLETTGGKLTRSVQLLTHWVRDPSPWKFELEGALSNLVRTNISEFTSPDTLLDREWGVVENRSHVYLFWGPAWRCAEIYRNRLFS